MTNKQQFELDVLLGMEAELSEDSVGFLNNLDQNFRDKDLSSKQEKWFNDLVARHL